MVDKSQTTTITQEAEELCFYKTGAIFKSLSWPEKMNWVRKAFAKRSAA